MSKPNPRLVAAIQPVESQVLAGATVDAVGTNTVDIDLLGMIVTDVPHLGGYTPTIGDVVTVLRSGARLLVLGTVAPGAGWGGGGGGGTPITVSDTAPSSPDVNDLWVEVP